TGRSDTILVKLIRGQQGLALRVTRRGTSTKRNPAYFEIVSNSHRRRTTVHIGGGDEPIHSHRLSAEQNGMGCQLAHHRSQHLLSRPSRRRIHEPPRPSHARQSWRERV